MTTPENTRPPSPSVKSGDLAITTDLENLQSAEQRRVLDVVSEVQRCGLNGVLAFPQLVACGDQSSGKSSVMEALTGVPFPRSDNLCTRYATEINLRRGNNDQPIIRVTPDEKRPSNEKEHINSFNESINDFGDLPRVMKLATEQMGISEDLASATAPRAFARDILSITIEGPARPQLTLVDIPGLIGNDTKGITKDDVALVAAITDSYIKNPRTICLAVISATNDYANQTILTKVRNVDPDGKRTLGIITKPDGLARGSGAEKAYIELAQNKDVVFELGWHVLKNRKFEESHFSLLERNVAEAEFFSSSGFKVLPQEQLGVDELRKRLSLLLFEHVKNELPKLRKDLDTTLRESQEQMRQLGISRATPVECKAYLFQISQNYWETCKDAVNGHYEDRYFLQNIDGNFNIDSASTIKRVRAVVQSLNERFAQDMENNGHKYAINTRDKSQALDERTDDKRPWPLDIRESLDWVREVLTRNRGKELIGNFNPLLIGELFREQATKWCDMATAHVKQVHGICGEFLRLLLEDKCLHDVTTRLWSSQIEDAIKRRIENALEELGKIMNEVHCHPINYNHYYTEKISQTRLERTKAEITRCIQGAMTTEDVPCAYSSKYPYHSIPKLDTEAALKLFTDKHEVNMENFSCSEVLDCLLAIYKVSPFPPMACFPSPFSN